MHWDRTGFEAPSRSWAILPASQGHSQQGMGGGPGPGPWSSFPFPGGKNRPRLRREHSSNQAGREPAQSPAWGGRGVGIVWVAGAALGLRLPTAPALAFMILSIHLRKLETLV